MISVPSRVARPTHRARGAVALGAVIVGLTAACARTTAGPAATPVASPSVGATSAPASAPEREYFAWVASEATDRIALVRFGRAGGRVEREFTTGVMPADVDGPHGLAISPDRKHVYISTAHGTPFGYFWKYSVEGDSLLGRVQLGSFPATAQITPDGAFAYVVNFNLHGEMVPSSVSIVSTDHMLEVARVQTCTMPHGSRINPQGTRHYSACMMDDMIVEIDTRTLGAARHFMVAPGKERGESGPPHRAGHQAAAGQAHGGQGMEPPRPGDPSASSGQAIGCSPTWAQPSADGTRVYVACNKSSDIAEIDVARWALLRRIPAGPGVYNLAVTRDGRLLVGTNKRGQSVSVIDLASGKELARIPTKRKVVHGAAISDDDRYAFVSVEGIGSEPGTVEVIDLRALRSVAQIDVGQMAGGIDFWKAESAR
ncbi:MAG TPA: YncE family protein [Gemmatimonadaceae bacterium]|nr:YncE family protein [Gemmatimonadaceae bacterium]